VEYWNVGRRSYPGTIAMTVMALAAVIAFSRKR